MLLSALLQKANIDAIIERDTEIDAITTDSRRVKKNSLYIAIKGLHTDGHAYVGDAIRCGACAVVVERGEDIATQISECHGEIAVVEVDDGRVSSAKLFAAFYDNPQKKMKFIGITGTNGKTSCCRLIYEILTRDGKRCGHIGTIGTFTSSGKIDIRSNNSLANMTTPDPEELYAILDVMAREQVEYVIMEVTSHALSLSKVAPIEFEIGVFTNLSEDHLDFHADMESYFCEKKKLFSSCRRAVINYDDRYGRRLIGEINIPTYACSMEGGEVAYLAADVRQRGERGIEYKLISPRVRLRVRSNLMGGFNVMNTLESAVVALALGTPSHSIKETLASFSGIEGRLERVKISGRADFSVYVDYAHTPDALENLLRTARSLASRSQRIVLLFGCGGDRDRGKRAQMGKIALSMADFVIITADNSRSEETSNIINDIVSGLDGESAYTIIEDRRTAIEYAVKNARRGDIILLAGKGHENYEIDAYGKKPFSEKDYVKFYVNKYYER